MAQIFNPWADPPSTNTLTGDLASFEINDMEEPGTESSDETETEMPEHADAMMAQALAVISQQAELINKLMKSLGKTA
jgi:hypothetical protein